MKTVEFVSMCIAIQSVLLLVMARTLYRTSRHLLELYKYISNDLHGSSTDTAKNKRAGSCVTDDGGINTSIGTSGRSAVDGA